MRKGSPNLKKLTPGQLLLLRARKMCVIFGPLDMKGIIGAATVMGSLMYGTGHCWNGMINVHLRHQSLEDCPNDETFLQSFDHSNDKAKQLYPPVALVESVSDAVLQRYKVHRLHLVIVDLWRPWKVNQKQVKSLTDLLRQLEPSPYSDGTTPMIDALCWEIPTALQTFRMGTVWMALTFPVTFYGLIALTEESNFWLLESQTHRYVDLSLAGFLQLLGIRRFYDAFGLNAEVSIRTAALDAFQLQASDLSSDLLVSADAASARGWTDHKEQPVDLNAPEADLRNVPLDVLSVSTSEVDSDSSLGDDSSDDTDSDASSSDDSSGSEPPASEVSDQHSMLEHAYNAVYNAFHVQQDGTLQGGDATLNLMEIFPPH